jgi:Ca2+-binding EF-hand superfamily protein
MSRRILRMTLALSAFALATPALAAGADVPQDPQARFDLLDANHDGVLSKYEYDAEVAFAAIDGNHDARLSAAELEAVWGPPQKGEPSAADRIVLADLDADGGLDGDELQRATEMRFTWLDRNGDGNLELAEVQSTFGLRVRPGD